MGHSTISLLVCVLILCIASTALAAVVEHNFNVSNSPIKRVCQRQVKTVVNGRLPGPAIQVREGDNLVIHVFNKSPYNISIHWHGVHQLFSGWADGPAYVTQCPIVPGNSFTYKFNVTGQEGTLWWHAHISLLRETVHGALIIRPRQGRTYPFLKPYKEFPILLGEWWNANIVDIERDLVQSGGGPILSDARTMNGQPGDLYPCSSKNTHKFNVVQGKTYLLRIINAAMQDHLFFKVAQHTFTVVAVDARYTEPYKTDVIVIAPGQTADVLFTADQPRGNYYMTANPYSASIGVTFANGTTTAIIHYKDANSLSYNMPVLPDAKDTNTAHKFYSNLTGLTGKSNPHWTPVPRKVDEKMFIAFGLGLEPCGGSNKCTPPPFFGRNYRLSANLNNVSFKLPTKLSMLEAFHNDVKGIYTEDFPDHPYVEFNYTDTNIRFDMPLILIKGKETRVKRLKYNSVVEVVLQNTALITAENHPMHFHGFDLYVLAQGFGNYDPINDPKKFNLVNPQERSTIAVPIGGWAVVRFRANNPGVWLMHCHREMHLPWGLSMAFIIENGPTTSTSLPPPPPDLPHC
ncbi:laccase [Ranunculus cassubicifolius]